MPGSGSEPQAEASSLLRRPLPPCAPPRPHHASTVSAHDWQRNLHRPFLSLVINK